MLQRVLQENEAPQIFQKSNISYTPDTHTHVLRPVTLLKRLCYRCFPVNFAKFQRTHFVTDHLRWLLLQPYQKSMMKLTAKIVNNF